MKRLDDVGSLQRAKFPPDSVWDPDLYSKIGQFLSHGVIRWHDAPIPVKFDREEHLNIFKSGKFQVSGFAG